MLLLFSMLAKRMRTSLPTLVLNSSSVSHRSIAIHVYLLMIVHMKPMSRKRRRKRCQNQTYVNPVVLVTYPDKPCYVMYAGAPHGTLYTG
ncbi:hypothetical protein BD769DRAFT_1441024 [Suillus cothurnatus]|nr:hypothetical protein BD769DRAFT_1441024 [Suillus cothurnatus]